jgi:hypothetical protein
MKAGYDGRREPGELFNEPVRPSLLSPTLPIVNTQAAVTYMTSLVCIHVAAGNYLWFAIGTSSLTHCLASVRSQSGLKQCKRLTAFDYWSGYFARRERHHAVRRVCWDQGCRTSIDLNWQQPLRCY